MLVGRVMQWLSSRPLGRAAATARNEKYDGRLAEPDVLGQADRGDRVEAALGDVAVVLEPHLGEVGEPGLGDRLLRPLRLLPRTA